ncbi:hypothetical protein OS493_036981 [Desmophyllum pertusum]|uniref:Uncharacterized protein n=1 Tax=Desmophyllum pertusum TaxID=174260 RepID=A0A9W9YXT4_9CNID|nr:hypothetical protein OS493_036981 [Desmophyllum pertusum]
MLVLTGNNRNLTYKFSFKEFWHSLTSQSEQELAKRKAESMVIQQIAKAAEQVCENELNRCKWQSEFNMKSNQQKQWLTRPATKRKKADDENFEDFDKLRKCGDESQSSIDGTTSEEYKMPTSMKQLEQRYTDACANINDTRDYIKTQLFQEVTCYVLSTHKQKRRQLRVHKTKPCLIESLPAADLDKYEAILKKLEEVLNQCERAIRSERSRRQFALQIEARCNEEKQKGERMRVHKEERRQKRLILMMSPPFQRGKLNQP